MYTLQQLLSKLDDLDVEPDELALTGREFQLLLQRAKDIVDSDSNDDDDD